MPTPAPVEVVSWGPLVSEAIERAATAALAFGVVVVVLLTAAALAVLTRRGA